MRILLNSTAGELGRLGGDFSFYRDLAHLSDDVWQFDLIPENLERRLHEFLRKGLDRTYRLAPGRLRQSCFIRSRQLPIPRSPGSQTDLVLSHLLFPHLPRDLKIPIIWSSQGILPMSYYEWYGMRLEDVISLYRVFGRESSLLISWTRIGAELISSYVPELDGKVEVIHPPVASPLRRNEIDRKISGSTSRDVVNFLFVGVDGRRKGLDELIAAFRQLPEDTAARLTIVSASVLPRAEHPPHTRFLGLLPRHEIFELMTNADVVVLPSRADSYALTIVESMARGCATIVSDLPPLPEVAPANEVGLVVPTKDVSSLTKAITTLSGDRPQLLRYQRAAIDLHARRNSPTAFLESLSGALRRLGLGRSLS